jgi:hypothetical protein
MDTLLDPTYSEEFASTRPTPICVHGVRGFVCSLDSVLTPHECDSLIKNAEEKGFSSASLYTDKQGVEHYSDIRKSQRTIIDSQAFVDELWKRIRHTVPQTWGGRTLHIPPTAKSPLNPRLRFLKYATPGDEFQLHCDGQYASPDGGISQLTILLYLNIGYEGAFTHFVADDDTTLVPILPTVGGIAIQDQRLMHCVPPLISGTKYVIRTEVMYKAQ